MAEDIALKWFRLYGKSMLKKAHLKISVALGAHAASDTQKSSVVEIVVDVPLNYCDPWFDLYIIQIAIIETN